MKGLAKLLGSLGLVLGLLVFIPSLIQAAEPIIIGVPTSLGFLEGAEGLNSVNLAVEEINAKGGVSIKGEKHPLKVEAIDIRDAAPGVPVPEALLGIEKLILEKKIKAIVLAPFRSEALLASMDLISKYKIPMLATTAMSPDYTKKVLENYDKYKYCFRVCLDSGYLVGYLKGTMDSVQKEYGFKKVYLMHQDVAWARGTANALAGILKGRRMGSVGRRILSDRGQRFFRRSDEGPTGRRSGHPADLRYAPERHSGQAVEQHEGPGPDARVYFAFGRPGRLEEF